jgi:hypothetical protein
MIYRHRQPWHGTEKKATAASGTRTRFTDLPFFTAAVNFRTVNQTSRGAPSPARKLTGQQVERSQNTRASKQLHGDDVVDYQALH